MKFKEIPYSRPDISAVKNVLSELTKQLNEAEDYKAARALFLRKEKLEMQLETAYTLVSIRHSIDTRDSFYDAESEYWNNVLPEVEEYLQQWEKAMYNGKYRADFEKEYGKTMFLNTALSLKTFSPDIIPDLQAENELVLEYEKLIAGAKVSFEGSIYTISQMTPFKNAPDDKRRHSAWCAEGSWYKDNQEALDRIYDKLVSVRTAIAKKLGYKDFKELGYYRMQRNCYDENDVAVFRNAVVKYLVPVAESIYKAQAKRLGKEYPMSFADNALMFKSGNPKPAGTPEDILSAGMRFYAAQSPETEEFFKTMLENDLLDVLSTEGKQAGGYCTQLWDYKLPFIFANFNGTQGDIEVVTHEAGHAFSYYMNKDRVPHSYAWPSMEGCEVHSMSMEFFGEEFAEEFFGKDAAKFRYSHLAGALVFIPYGTMVDHFQHSVYEHPEYTPADRHAEWKRLLSIYMPWMRLDGNIPFYADGEGWQRQLHIYTSPFYYIDYCLAQTVSLEFWSLLRSNKKAAWEKYMAYTVQGGSKTFTELLECAGLDSPFSESCLKEVCEKAQAFLNNYDLSNID